MPVSLSENYGSLSNLIFVTNTLSGHRLTWLSNIYNLQFGSKDAIKIIITDEPTSKNIDSGIFEFHQALSNHHAIEIAEGMFKKNRALTFVFLDGEQWIRVLFRSHLPSKILMMRPFVSKFSLIALVNFHIKYFTIGCLNMKRNLDIRFLKIPHHKTILRKSKWINDNLTTSDILRNQYPFVSNVKAVRVLVPGFINERKRPSLIIKIAADLEHHFPNVFEICFLGTIDHQTRELIEASGLENVSYQDKYFERSDYLDMIRGADLVLLLYKNRSASGIIMEALALNKNVIIQRSYLWRQLRQVSAGRLKYISKRRRHILNQFKDIILQKELPGEVIPDRGYEFTNLDDDSGLIYFIFKPSPVN